MQKSLFTFYGILALLFKLILALKDNATQIFLEGRFNYASIDCAARILAINPGAKSATSVLTDKKDDYLLNLCSFSQKFLVLELCQDIKLEYLVIANYELFSSNMKEFTVSILKKYPPTPSSGWKSLGTFHAENTKEDQIFSLPKPVTFAKFIKIEFISHYGNEYYCPLSSIKAYGKTMMDEFEEGHDQIIKESSNIQNEKKTIEIDNQSHHPSSPSPISIPSSSLIMNNTDESLTRSSQPTFYPRYYHYHHYTNDEKVNFDKIKDLHHLMNMMNMTTCPATMIPSSISIDTDIDLHENIFKAIDNRLQKLEKKLGSIGDGKRGEDIENSGKIKDILRKLLEDDLEGIQESKKTKNENENINIKKSRLIKIIHNINKISTRNHVQRELKSVSFELKRLKRIIKWILIAFAILIIILLFGFILKGKLLTIRKIMKKFQNDQFHNHNHSIHHSRSSSEEKRNENSFGHSINPFNSPLKDDQLMITGPLLDDENEALILDANYFNTTPKRSSSALGKRIESPSPSTSSLSTLSKRSVSTNSKNEKIQIGTERKISNQFEILFKRGKMTKEN